MPGSGDSAVGLQEVACLECVFDIKLTQLFWRYTVQRGLSSGSRDNCGFDPHGVHDAHTGGKAGVMP